MAPNKQYPVIPGATMFDLTIADIQKGLIENIPWLNYAFGKAQRLGKKIGDRIYYTPNVYSHSNEYIPVSPDSGLGNFCFFNIEDPQTLIVDPGLRADISTKVSIVFWVDLRTIPGAENRNTEAIKNELLQALNSKIWIKSGRLKLGQIWERSENVYKGYTLDEIDNQFLMHPYYGFRFEGTLTIQQPC